MLKMPRSVIRLIYINRILRDTARLDGKLHRRAKAIILNGRSVCVRLIRSLAITHKQAILTQENVRKENNIHKQFDKNLKHTQHSENAENGK